MATLNPTPPSLAGEAKSGDLSLDTLAARYLRHIESLNYSPPTLTTKQVYFNRFGEFLAEARITGLQTVTATTLADFQRWIFYQPTVRGMARGVSSQNRVLSAIRNFFKFLHHEGYLTHNPAQDLRLSKEPDALPKNVLTPEEARKILEAPDTHTRVGYRDRTLLEVLYASGIRKAELRNPPYNAYAGISPEEEQGLVEVYKGVYEVDQIRGDKKVPKQSSVIKKIRKYRLSDPISKGGWGIRKFNLDDLYVRFFRLAERRIAEKTGRGVISFISNFSYLGDPSFVIMRQRFLQEFDTLWFDCLNGDSRETGKLTPEGKSDPSVFSTEYNREGIRVGTAIGLMVRRPERAKKPQIFFRQFWGVDKRAELLESLKTKNFAEQYGKAEPKVSDRFSFRISDVGADYLGWPALLDLCAKSPISGLQEMRKGTLMAYEKTDLEKRMRQRGWHPTGLAPHPVAGIQSRPVRVR